MKKILLVSLVLACLPTLIMAQDDLYFIPKKKTEKKVTTVVKSVDDKVVTRTQTTPGTTVLVKDVKGEVRDVDEYNRRYTSRDNTFSMENDTLYIEEKPYNERGEWVNGFEGTQDDYEYAMRIVRFRNPRFAIPVSSPLYWDVIYSLPSWEWNVFDDGLYAYAFPTYSNRLWWDWRWNYPWGSSWSYSLGWHSPWLDSWYGPGYWGGGYWGGYWGHHYHHHWHPIYHRPMYAGIGGYWGNRHGRFGSSALNPRIHAGRYSSNVNRGEVAKINNRRQVSATTARTGRNTNMDARRARRNDAAVSRGESSQNSVRKSTAGRVVRSNSDNTNSVRPRTTTRTNEGTDVRNASNSRRSNNNTYVRSTESKGSSYNRPSSTRSSVTNRTSSYQRKNESSSYRNSSTSRSTQNNSTYRSNSNTRSSSSSYSSGGGGSRSSAGGGTRSSGGGSRGGRR